jgi:hypothetical protein
VVRSAGPEEAAAIRALCPSLFFLIPDYGAQGIANLDAIPAILILE